MLIALYACGLIGFMLAMSRDRNPALWFVLALATGPVGLVALLVLPRGKVASPHASSQRRLG